MEPTQSFGYWLRRRRKALDLTQQKLAELVHCEAITIKKIEADERRPSASLAQQLARHLAIPPADHPIFLRAARGEVSSIERLPAPLDVTRLLPATPQSRQPISLPPSIAHLFGRSAAIATIQAWLRTSERRLITLVGPPGIGKTSLSLYLATLLHDEYHDGVQVISLVSLQTPDQVLGALARTIGVPEMGRQPFPDRVLLALRDQHMLLIFDNYEHVISSAPLLADILANCPNLRILVTSREILRLRDEHVFRVLPLELPPLLNGEPPAPLDLPSLIGYPAIQLFVARAQAMRPEFALGAENARAVVEICQRLDGLPLAIELAAGWIALLEPPALLAQLEQHGIGVTLHALGQQARDLPLRHQTLRQAIEWSYNLLSERERSFFRTLAVFVGGWTSEAVTAVNVGAAAVNSTSEHAPLVVLADLHALLLKSIIQHQSEAERFTMLEFIREYAWERLREDERFAQIQRCHADYYCAFAIRSTAELHGSEQQLWLDQLEIEYANIHRAFTWLYDRDETVYLLRLSAAMGNFWIMRGHLDEGRQWLIQALARSDQTLSSGRDRAMALLRLADISLHQHERSTAQSYYESSLALFEALADQAGCAWARYGLRQITASQDQEQALHHSLDEFRGVRDQVGEADVLNTLGSLARWRGEYAKAHALHTASLICATEIGDLSQQAWSHALLGKVLANQGEYAASREHYETSITLFGNVGNRFRLTWAMQGLGEVYLWEGHTPMASDTFTACFTRFRSMGDQNGMAWATYNQGRVAFQQGDLSLARIHLEDSLQRFQSINDHHDSAWALTVLGQVLAYSGDIAGAWNCYHKSLLLHQQAGNQHGIVHIIEGVATLLAEDIPTAAVRLWGAATLARTECKIPLPCSERARREQQIVKARERLGEAGFIAAWSDGQAQMFDAIVDQVKLYCAAQHI